MKYLAFLIILCATIIDIYGADPAKVVFLYSGRNHASGEHEWRAGSMLLADHLNKQNAVPINAITHAGWPKDESILEDANAIVILCNATAVTRNGWETLDRLTQQGVGLMLIHYAVHPSKEEGEKYFMPWVGGFYRTGKSVNPFWGPEITPLDGHAVCCGVKPFRAIDEFYFNLEFDENVLPLGVATPTEENFVRINNHWNLSGYDQLNQEQILLWGFERKNGGRGAGFTGGHYHRNWAIDDYRRLVLNTIVWITGKEVPEDGVPTPSLTKEELNANMDQYPPNKMAVLELPTAADFDFEPGPWLTVEEHKAARAKLKAEQEAQKKAK